MLREEFDQKILPKLKKELHLQNDLRVPKPEKGLVQIGFGKLITQQPDQKETIINEVTEILAKITGQKPKIIPAKKSVSGFHLRKGMPISALVTLRKKRLLDFIERFIFYALPRARDFKGVQKKMFDQKGNLNFGFKDATIFPEAVSDKIKRQYGLQVTLVGTGRNFKENIALWKVLGFPMKI